MISVVIPTLNSAETLAESLAALIPAAVDALVREVVVADGGSTDDTFAIADDAGARFLTAQGDRAARVAAGCAQAKGPWLLILYPETRLGSEWIAAAKAHLADHPKAAGYFRLALDEHGVTARLKEAAAALFGRPGGEQGLLIPKAMHEAGVRPRTRPLPARAFRLA
jgi:cellulose synthase/poly-beta-1,6-N-acetylglucosamine synthase-like glycosyltransferase